MSIADSNYYDLDIQSQKTLQMILIRAQRPCKLSAFVSKLSMESFKGVSIKQKNIFPTVQ